MVLYHTKISAYHASIMPDALISGVYYAKNYAGIIVLPFTVLKIALRTAEKIEQSSVLIV